MNFNGRYRYGPLNQCSCGREPMRVYCAAADRFAVKCDCGKRTVGFTTIAGASRNWNSMNKKEPPVRVPVPQAAEQKNTRPLSARK